MLENLLEYYRKSDGATKKKILGCIFAEKLVLETRIPRWVETLFRKAEKEKLQPLSSRNQYNSSSGLVRFWGVLKKKKRVNEEEGEKRRMGDGELNKCDCESGNEKKER